MPQVGCNAEHSGAEITVSLEGLPGIQTLETMWRDLERRADSSFFLSWEWIGTWLAESGARPMLMIGRRGEAIVALGLLSLKTRRIGPIKFDTLFLHQTGDKDFDCITIEFNDFLLAKECQVEARIACVKELIRVRRATTIHRWKLRWAGAPCDLARLLSAVNVRVQITKASPSPFLDLGLLREEGHDYLEVLSRNTRSGIRRTMKLYEGRSGPLSIAAAASVEERECWLEELRRLHQAHWEAKGKPGAFKRPFFGRFLSRLISGPSPHHVDLLRIRAGDIPIGYLCNFVYAGSVMNYQSGFLYDADGRHKPGLVSHSLAIRYYVDQRPDMKEYSFLAGDSQYKRSLSTAAKQLNWYVIRPA